MLLKDQANGIEVARAVLTAHTHSPQVDTISQAVAVPAKYAEQAKAGTPADYEFISSGFATPIKCGRTLPRNGNIMPGR